MRLASKLAINEKSTIFVQFWWNFAKSSYKWGSQLVKVWSRLDKNCGIFINSQFWYQSHFLWISLYLLKKLLKSWFHEKCSERISRFSTLWVNFSFNTLYDLFEPSKIPWINFLHWLAKVKFLQFWKTKTEIFVNFERTGFCFWANFNLQKVQNINKNSEFRAKMADVETLDSPTYFHFT